MKKCLDSNSITATTDKPLDRGLVAKNMAIQLFFLFTVLLSTTASFALPENDGEEIRYEDLVNQLTAKRKANISRSTPDTLDNLKIHAGIGLIGSANSVNINGSNAIKYQNGFQVSLGIDLFSPEWASEVDMRNFGQTKSGTETRSLREFDLKFMNRAMFNSIYGYRLGAGIGNRYLKIEDERNDISVNDNTPCGLMLFGLDSMISKNMSVGLEGVFHSSLINRTADRNSLDMTVRLDTYF